MSNNFKESIKTNYPQKIQQLSNENQILIQKLNQIPQNKELLYSGEDIGEIWNLMSETLAIGSECEEILRNSEAATDAYQNEQLTELSEERREIERCVNLISDRLRTDYDNYAINSELIMGIWEKVENIKMNHQEKENKAIQKSLEKQNSDDGGERGGGSTRTQEKSVKDIDVRNIFTNLPTRKK